MQTQFGDQYRVRPGFLLGFWFIARAGFVELQSAFGVIRGAALDGGELSGLMLFVEFFEVRHAPAASSTRAETFGDERCDRGILSR